MSWEMGGAGPGLPAPRLRVDASWLSGRILQSSTYARPEGTAQTHPMCDDQDMGRGGGPWAESRGSQGTSRVGQAGARQGLQVERA